jgi:hypothetical protein
MGVDLINIVYGATPKDSGEAIYNKLTAEQVGQALDSFGIKTRLFGLSCYDAREVMSDKIFNLCDGDDPEDRFEIVSFAREIKGKAFTGSNAGILSLAKDKPMSWAVSFKVPRFWDAPPLEPFLPFIAKPRCAHGSLFIRKDNINGTGGFLNGDYFFQEYLTGAEYTTCFLGNQFLGTCRVLEDLDSHSKGNFNIISRDDKWETQSVLSRPKRVWDIDGLEYPEVKYQASLAWAELREMREPKGELAYGRVDLRADALGVIYVIDINPNSYIGRDGLFYSCWAAHGGSYEKLILTLASPLLS